MRRTPVARREGRRPEDVTSGNDGLGIGVETGDGRCPERGPCSEKRT